MSQYVSDPPEEKTLPISEPAYTTRTRLSRMGFIALFVLIGLSLLLFSDQIILGLTQVSPARADQQELAQSTHKTLTPTARSSISPTPTLGTEPTPTPTALLPFYAPSNASMPTLQLPAGHYVIYQTATHIRLVSTTDNTTLSLYTPSYAYSQAVKPILTPAGQLIYAGSNSIWITDIFDQQPTEIAQTSPNTVVASLALSQDGKMIAWSTEPTNGTGQISIYAGPLTNPALVRQQSIQNCPCFRVFSFLNGTTTTDDTTLLLTDDHGSNEAIQYGLWSLDISTPSADPQSIMDETSQQGPLAFVPYSSGLLYSPYEGAVPAPTDNSVPSDVAALSYANSLSIAVLSSLELNNPQVVLPGQTNLANNAALNRWVTTPSFSPDGHTLAYVEFSSDIQEPYDRHSAIYTIQVNGSGSSLQVSHPHLVITSTTKLLELGPWLNSHIVTMYADGSIYAMDVQSGTLNLLASPGGYLRILGTIGTGQM